MPRASLDNIRLVVSPLTGEPYIARFGKDPALALEKRGAELELMAAIVGYMMHDCPTGASQQVTFDSGEHWYEVSVSPISKAEAERVTPREEQE